MNKFVVTFSKFITDFTPFIVLSAAIISYLHPSYFSWIVSYKQVAILGFIMLSMGLTLSKNDIMILASRPLDILIGTFAQFTFMPLIAWLLIHFLQLNSQVVIGFTLVACCPGGVSSNIMSYLCKGDVAYSVGMTTVNTLLAPVVTPALVYLLIGQTVNVDFIGMFVNILLVTLVPVTAGFVLNIYFGRKNVFKDIKTIMPALSIIALALIVGGVVTAIADKLTVGGFTFLIWTFVLIFLHNSLGYIIGYIFGAVIKLGEKKTRTLSLEVGMQNAGLATTLASTFFMATYPIAIVPCAIACIWHSISGTIVVALFNLKDKLLGND